MLRVASRTCLAGLIIVVFSLTACSKKQEVPPEISPLADENGQLRYVPADTPYIFAALEPLPDELLDKLEPKVDRILASYRTMLRLALEQSFTNNEDAAVDEAQRERVRAVVDEVSGLLSVEALRRIGIARDSAFLFYGHGLLPVLRITLSDTAAFEAEIERLEQAAGQALPRQTIGDIEYRYFEADQARVVVALLQGQLVITAAPVAFDDSQISELLGIALPSPNLAESGLLKDIADEYGYQATQMGMISTERLAHTFLEQPDGMNKALLALAGYDAATVTDVCRAELRSLAAVMPRTVFGARSISTARIESSVVVELRPDIASGLRAIPAAVPGLGTTYSGLISFGMSFNLLEARRFLEARLEALEASPYRCEQLADFNSAAGSARQALDQPVPPVAYNFRGFLALVNDLQGFDPRTKAPPESIEASFLIGIEDPTQLLAFGQMVSPELAALTFEADGPAQRLELPNPAGAIDSAWIALSDNALAVSVDPDAEASLAQMLNADSAMPPPFLSIGIDVARYYGMIGAVMAGAENETDAEIRAAMTDIMDAVGDFYDRVALDVHFTERGIEIAGDATLGD